MSHSDFRERFMAALATGDFDALAPMLDPDFVLHEAEGLPYSGTYRGLQGWRDVSAAVVSTWAGFRLRHLEDVAESADSLVVRFAISGRSRRTGRPFETSVMELWRFRDGRLAEVHPYYWDTAALAAADKVD